jgi:hypothetical protein
MAAAVGDAMPVAVARPVGAVGMALAAVDARLRDGQGVAGVAWRQVVPKDRPTVLYVVPSGDRGSGDLIHAARSGNGSPRKRRAIVSPIGQRASCRIWPTI